MTFLPTPVERGPRPFSEWRALGDELVPFIGERALLLFSFALCDEFGDDANAGYFRALLVESGNDVENPQVTETERLMLEWARLIVRDPRAAATDRNPRLEAAFSPQLRALLVRFAALTVATSTVSVVGGSGELASATGVTG